MSTKKKTNTKSNNDKDVKTTSYVPMIVAIVALILVVAIVLPIALSGGKSDPLADYTEDTSTEKKDYYYVAMAIEDEGVIIVKLDAKNAPITTANFVKLVRSGFYDGLTFHRVMENFMIQGGDPQANGLGGSDETIIGEFITNGVYNPIKHEKGVISMARGSHSNDSASSQFFICNSSSASVQGLDGYYAAFGHVIEGIEIVDNITAKTARFGVNNGMITNKKKQAVITKMMVIEYEETV